MVWLVKVAFVLAEKINPSTPSTRPCKLVAPLPYDHVTGDETVIPVFGSKDATQEHSWLSSAPSLSSSMSSTFGTPSLSVSVQALTMLFNA